MARSSRAASTSARPAASRIRQVEGQCGSRPRTGVAGHRALRRAMVSNRNFRKNGFEEVCIEAFRDLGRLLYGHRWQCDSGYFLGHRYDAVRVRIRASTFCDAEASILKPFGASSLRSGRSPNDIKASLIGMPFNLHRYFLAQREPDALRLRHRRIVSTLPDASDDPISACSTIRRQLGSRDPQSRRYRRRPGHRSQPDEPQDRRCGCHQQH